MAQAHEIGRMLGALRKAGLPVVCHANEYTNATYLLASVGCTKIWISAIGQTELVGLSFQLVFAKGLLDKLHVTADFEQVGKFKGAEEPFTRDRPSPEAKETLESTLRGQREAWIGAIVEGRGNLEVAPALEDGPFPAAEAKEKGLVDEIGYSEDAREDIKKLSHSDQFVARFGSTEDAPGASRGLVDILRAISGAGKGGAPHVAVLRASGAIGMSGPSPLSIGSSDAITEKELGKQLSDLQADASVKAVVLRIDSPGGSALASDLIWKRLMKLRAEKPLVMSIGSMAASGGYYLACAGNKVFAEPTSIVGSIGVVGGKFSIGATLEQLGVHSETVTATPDDSKARRSTYMSPLTTWDDATRGRIRAAMEATYDVFLKRISEGRGRPVDAFAASAEGRLFAGTEAKERGLIDELGGLDDAIRAAVTLAKLAEDTPIEVVGDNPTLFDLLDGGDDAKAAVDQAAGRAALAAIAPAFERLGPELSTFVDSVAPLLSEERIVAALPYALLLR
jgi:protease-4